MRLLPVMIALAGCGGGNNASIDAAIDTPIDMTPLALDCTTYCTEILRSCTSTNAQYLNLDQCTHACASFTVGASTVTDTTGNTLGCRIRYAVAAETMATAHCPHAGPAGDLITAATPAFCSGGDACTSFCTLEILACGSQEVPLAGDPKDEIGDHVYQYVNQANCVSLCHGWDKIHNYSTTAVGDSLACRLSAAVTASVSVDSAKVHCADTASFPTGQCAGTASP